MYHSPSEPAEGIQQILVDYRTQMQNCAIMQILFHANIDDQEVIISGLREFGVPAELIGQFRIIIATK
jgi:hypothetical protein